MDLYADVAYRSSRLLTLAYSSSFGLSSRLFARPLRAHIYAVYGLVRIADEIVDTYTGPEAGALLDRLEDDVRHAIKRGYDPSPVVHAFALTARTYGIGDDLTHPFFHSMRIDLQPQTYDESLYRDYIHGSAEVVGLMCLRVFCDGDDATYRALAPGAAALGAAYQKINFLRDLADDHARLGRVYFPGVAFDTFDDQAKQAIVRDITKDFTLARAALVRLPRSSRVAVTTSYVYYAALLDKLARTPAAVIKQRRIRLPDTLKLLLLIKVIVTEGWKR